MNFKPVYTNKAPKPVGPYSQALKVGPWLFCSGQISLDPLSGQIVGQDIKTQTEQVFRNITAVLEAENLEFRNIVKVMVFLTDIKEFSEFNRVYESYFSEHKPVRSLVEVSSLPKFVKVEVEVTAFKSD